MLIQVVLGETICKQGVTRTERNSLIDWCQKFQKKGQWKPIRSMKCWCKLVELAGGEVRLKVAIRHELFAQIKADRRLIEMGPKTFSRRAAKYEVGTVAEKDRPQGQRAVVLTDDFVIDLTAGCNAGDDLE